MPDDEQIYHDLIMDRFRNPLHAGRPEVFDAEAEGDNPMCGDQIHVYYNQDGARVMHESRGCAIMIASAELMADAVAGADAAQIQQLRSAFERLVATGQKDPSLGALNAMAGVSEYRSRIRCATLPWSALADALRASLLGDALNAPTLADASKSSALARSLGGAE